MSSATSGRKRSASSREGDSGKINAFIRHQDGTLTQYIIGPDIKCGSLFKYHCDMKDLSYRSMEFLYNLNRVSKNRTFRQMGFGDGVEIDAMEHMPGGGI